MMASCEVKLSQLRQLEGELEELVKTLGFEDISVSRSRYCLQLLYRDFVIEFPSEAHAENVDAMLWRYCFYLPIDYYRRQLKDPKSVEGRWAIAELDRIIEMGLAFFSLLFYELTGLKGSSISEDKTSEIFSVLGLPPPTTIISSSNSSGGNDGGILKVVPGVDAINYRLLIFCGDLVRYRGQFNRPFQQDYHRLAWDIYMSAHCLEPDRGHAANQLAVVCSLLGDTLMTIFWYLRGESCSLFFAASRQNLLAFLEKTLLKDPQNKDGGGDLSFRPFLKFILDALRSTVLIDSFQVSTWMDRKVSSISSADFSIILLIMSACTEKAIDIYGFTFWILAVLVQQEDHNKLPVFGNSDDEKLLLLFAVLTALKSLECLKCHEQLLQWFLSIQHLPVTETFKRSLWDLKGWVLVDELVEYCMKIPKDSMLLSGLLQLGYKIPGMQVVDNMIVIMTTSNVKVTSSSPSPSMVITTSSLEVNLLEDCQGATDKGNACAEEEVVLFRGLVTSGAGKADCS